MNRPKISIVTVNWWAEDFAKLLCRKAIKNLSNGEIEIIIVDNSKNLNEEDFVFENCQINIIKPNYNMGHGGGLNLGVKHARGEYVMILDIDSHILLPAWDFALTQDFYDDENLKLIAAEGGKLKPVRPLFMLFKKYIFREAKLCFQAKGHEGVKFDVGIHAYFKILTKYGDKSVKLLKHAKTEYKEVLGDEYLLNGQRAIYHNWYGTRWFNAEGKRVHDKIDKIEWNHFKKCRESLFTQV